MLNLWTAVVDVDDRHASTSTTARYGLTPDQLVGEDYTPTRALADVVTSSGATAMIVPSAALPGTHNLILFGVRVLNPFSAHPHAEEIPTGHLTDGARAPAEAAPYVRWFGTPHKAAEQWKTTGNYEPFDDPTAMRCRGGHRRDRSEMECLEAKEGSTRKLGT